MNTPFRCYSKIKLLNNGVFDVVANSRVGVGLGFIRKNSSDKGSGCCKDIVQTEGKKAEPRPKPSDPPAAWRCGPSSCPTRQPYNYDPYRIKVPDTLVPPMPPSNAKHSGLVSVASGESSDQSEPKIYVTSDQEVKYPQYNPQQYPNSKDQDQHCRERTNRKKFFDQLKELLQGTRQQDKGNNRNIMTGMDHWIYLPVLDFKGFGVDKVSEQ